MADGIQVLPSREAAAVWPPDSNFVERSAFLIGTFLTNNPAGFFFSDLPADITSARGIATTLKLTYKGLSWGDKPSSSSLFAASGRSLSKLPYRRVEMKSIKKIFREAYQPTVLLCLLRVAAVPTEYKYEIVAFRIYDERDSRHFFDLFSSLTAPASISTDRESNDRGGGAKSRATTTTATTLNRDGSPYVVRQSMNGHGWTHYGDRVRRASRRSRISSSTQQQQEEEEGSPPQRQQQHSKEEPSRTRAVGNRRSSRKKELYRYVDDDDDGSAGIMKMERRKLASQENGVVGVRYSRNRDDPDQIDSNDLILVKKDSMRRKSQRQARLEKGHLSPNDEKKRVHASRRSIGVTAELDTGLDGRFQTSTAAPSSSNEDCFDCHCERMYTSDNGIQLADVRCQTNLQRLVTRKASVRSTSSSAGQGYATAWNRYSTSKVNIPSTNFGGSDEDGQSSKDGRTDGSSPEERDNNRGLVNRSRRMTLVDNGTVKVTVEEYQDPEDEDRPDHKQEVDQKDEGNENVRGQTYHKDQSVERDEIYRDKKDEVDQKDQIQPRVPRVPRKQRNQTFPRDEIDLRDHRDQTHKIDQKDQHHQRHQRDENEQRDEVDDLYPGNQRDNRYETAEGDKIMYPRVQAISRVSRDRRDELNNRYREIDQIYPRDQRDEMNQTGDQLYARVRKGHERDQQGQRHHTDYRDQQGLRHQREQHDQSIRRYQIDQRNRQDQLDQTDEKWASINISSNRSSISSRIVYPEIEEEDRDDDDARRKTTASEINGFSIIPTPSDSTGLSSLIRSTAMTSSVRRVFNRPSVHRTSSSESGRVGHSTSSRPVYGTGQRYKTLVVNQQRPSRKVARVATSSADNRDVRYKTEKYD